VVEHLRVMPLAASLLILQNLARAPRKSSEKQQQVVLECKHRFDRNLERLGYHRIVLVEREASQSAVGSDVLILFADWLPQSINFDLTGELSEILRVQWPPAVRVQGLQQCGCKTSRRAQAGACWNVRQGCDLELRRFEVEQLDRLANDRVVHVFGGVDV